jgi:Uma2 family endonuclease
MAQVLLHKVDGHSRLAITALMLDALVAAGTIEDPARVELIEGELAVCTSVSRKKGILQAKLLGQLANYLAVDFEVLVRVSVRLDDYNEPMPDICVARADVTSDVLYSNDCVLVVEVRDAAARKDGQLKAPLYAKAGIPELWVLDINTAETIVHRGPSASGWADVVALPFADTLTALFDSNINIIVAEL